MARERRTENVLAWVGAGALAGALLLAVVTVGLHWSGQDEGLFETAGWGWLWACLLGGFTLKLGVRWKREHADDAPAGWDYVIGMGFVAALAALIAGHGALLGANADGFGGLAPSELRMGIVVCAVALGLLLMLTVVRRPLLPPRTRSLPSFGAGALAVVLVGVGAPLLVGGSDGSEVRHVVAEDPPEAAAVPDRVQGVGWGWEPDGEATVNRIVSGAHGPLAVLSDGVVSLDGTDGTEVWSYRRPAEEAPVSVWVGNGQVYVTHTPAGDTGSDSDADSDADSDSGSDEEGGEPRVTEAFDRATGELAAEYTGVPNEESDGDVGNPVGWSDGIRVHNDLREGQWDMSAWDAESGEELWFRRLASEEGRVCEGRSPRVRQDTVVYAVVCVSEDDLVGSEPYDRHIDLGGAVHSEFRIVSVDLRTGQETWSDERDGWDGAFIPGRPRVAPDEGDRGDALVVLSGVSGVPGLLLDPDTGEELLHLTEELLEVEEDLVMERVLDADSDGATVLYRRGAEGAEIHHVDTAGNRTELIGAGGVHLDRFSEIHVVLADQMLNFDGHYSQYEERAQILVSSPGERLGEGLDNRIAMESQKVVEQLVAVPGGVAVLLDDLDSNAHVEGLVP